jgi:hypothetical protein
VVIGVESDNEVVLSGVARLVVVPNEELAFEGLLFTCLLDASAYFPLCKLFDVTIGDSMDGDGRWASNS